MACRLAICPTMRSPSRVKPTTDGVVRIPSELAITIGFPPSMTATTELVVPRSMPTTLPMRWFSPYVLRFGLVVRLSILSRQVRQKAKAHMAKGKS